MVGIKQFQSEIVDWMRRCFRRSDSMTSAQRSFRFVEEALELAQAMGTSREEVLQLVEYVYSRPEGSPEQEIGGVMVTLCGVAESVGLSVEEAAVFEAVRCEQNIEKIRAKDLAKPERAGAKPS